MKLILLFICLTMFTGCGLFKAKERVVQVPVIVPVECEDFGKIDPVNILPVRFVQGVDKEGNQVLGLRGDQYSNLSLVIRDTLRYIRAQNEAVSYYKKCIEDHNSKAKLKGDPE